MQFHINALPLDQYSMEELKSVANDWYSAQKRDSEQYHSWSWELPAATGVGSPPPPSLLEVSGADISQPQEPGGGAFCPSCGTAAGAGAKFCLACGHAIPHRS